MSTPDDPGRPPGAAGAADAAGAVGPPADGSEAARPAAEAPRPTPPVGWLPDSADVLFGAGARAEETYELLTVDVPAESWISALLAARTTLGCTYFDWLSAVDEPGTGLRVAAHVAALPDAEDVARAERGAHSTADPQAEPVRLRRLLVRTTVPHDAAVLASAVDVYPGAEWHERETHEMFGIDFTDHPGLTPLLLPDGFEGHPLRKDFVLAARVAKAWPGAKEPGESDHGGPKRRQMLPPGVPDPNDWGPLKGQLPPPPARPARGARAAGAGGDRPVRRSRSVSAGSASQQAGTDASAAEAAPTREAPARPPRRTRSAGAGSASQRDASQAGTDAPEGAARPARSSPDAPWHDPRPATDKPSASGDRPAEPTSAEPTPAESTSDAAPVTAAPSRTDAAPALPAPPAQDLSDTTSPEASPAAPAAPASAATGTAAQAPTPTPSATDAGPGDARSAAPTAETEPRPEPARRPAAGRRPGAPPGPASGSEPASESEAAAASQATAGQEPAPEQKARPGDTTAPRAEPEARPETRPEAVDDGGRTDGGDA
ncbi:NADH-quinone oxidoreductase subunit C [Streptomyces sp. NPDC057702]|uniref:NADH-quinone oxidoreductase subunit C n=1 Tax=unclassified Streptomyces TaxID=2593676 RepID=UPI00369EE9B4